MACQDGGILSSPFPSLRIIPFLETVNLRLLLSKNTPRQQCVAENAARKAKRERERVACGKDSVACLSLSSFCDGDDDDDDKRKPNEGRRTRRVVVVFCSRRVKWAARDLINFVPYSPPLKTPHKH